MKGAETTEQKQRVVLNISTQLTNGIKTVIGLQVNKPVGPVSYTHLDVYKRQAARAFGCDLFRYSLEL